MAIVVEDEWQSEGVGKSLLLELASRARLRGLQTFTAEVLEENRRMLGLAGMFAGTGYMIAGDVYHVRMRLRDGVRGPDSSPRRMRTGASQMKITIDKPSKRNHVRTMARFREAGQSNNIATNRSRGRESEVTTEVTTQKTGTDRKTRSAVLVALALGMALATLVALMALAGTAREAQAAFPGNNGKIAFASKRTTGEGVDNPTGDSEIFKMNPDGTGLKQLTFNTASDTNPSFSADGSVVVFASNRDGNSEIYLMSPDGVTQLRVTDNTVPDDSPVVSLEGDIAYQSLRDGNQEIIVREAGVERNLTNNSAEDYSPAFSPDGSKIAFESYRDGDGEIYVTDVDGTNLKKLTKNAVPDLYPDWSPDGQRIAFTSYRSSNYDISVMNASDGTGRTRLTRNATSDFAPAWSPNGKKIAFTSRRNGNYDIYAVNAGTKVQKRLTTNPALDDAPSWQPIVN